MLSLVYAETQSLDTHFVEVEIMFDYDRLPFVCILMIKSAETN